ncbi:MAG: putative oxygen-independent coproporphyrinogen III oxidase [Halioglobus sp.]|jgi:oxygen-independent coproporphyrinogen-3 oxidase
MHFDKLPPLSLYIHYPWCEKKCPYCDFNSHENVERPERSYIDALLLDLERDLHYVQGRVVETLFIGGGTPSLIAPKNLKLLMAGLAARLDLSPNLEATMEANPGSAESEKFEIFRSAGINRLSLGVQSFQNSQLEKLGRVHNSDQAHSAIELAKKAGFVNFNLDLMHGLPGQSVENACRDIEAALSHHPTHLSWYQLTIEPNTVFHSKPPRLPTEDTLADIQHGGEKFLSDAGFKQYEVSAYHQSDLTCRHNLNYWNFGDYLGIGAGAHGKVTLSNGEIVRYSKRKQPGEYIGNSETNFHSQTRVLQPQDIPGEFMMNALRLNAGFSLEQFKTMTGLPIHSIETVLDKLLDRKLLQREADQINTTELGANFLDSVTAEFLAD